MTSLEFDSRVPEKTLLMFPFEAGACRAYIFCMGNYLKEYQKQLLI